MAEVKNSGEKKETRCAKGVTSMDEYLCGFDELATLFLRNAVRDVYGGC
jgi:hypothetical protein